MTLKWDPQPEPKESVRISLEGVQSVMIDAEVLAEYRTTIEDLEKKLKQAKCDIRMWSSNRDIADRCSQWRLKRLRETESKVEGLERWRQSL